MDGTTTPSTVVTCAKPRCGADRVERVGLRRWVRAGLPQLRWASPGVVGRHRAAILIVEPVLPGEPPREHRVVHGAPTPCAVTDERFRLPPPPGCAHGPGVFL